VTILSDGGIRMRIFIGDLGIEPFDDKMVQPASVDFTLADTILVFNNHQVAALDPFDIPEGLHTAVTLTREQPFILHPGEFVLGATAERVSMPDDLVARCEGKSSLGRLGLQVHSTAGFVDPGFSGQVTLELSNVANFPLVLTPGMKVGQFAFETLDAPAQRPYGHPDLGSKYQNQSGPVASRYSENVRPATR
jgi:dCTP deaminase